MLENPLQISISCESYKSGSEESVGESCRSVENDRAFVHESDAVDEERDAEQELGTERAFVHESDAAENEHDAEQDLGTERAFVHESDAVENDCDADQDLGTERAFVHESNAVENVRGAVPDLERTGTRKELTPEKEELELKVSSTLTLMDELEVDFQDESVPFDSEKKNFEVALLSKAAEVEELAAQLNSRECQMEALMQKFRDELFSMDRQVEKERKERDEVMEMHFTGKRRLVAEIREKEESWQNDVEAITQELIESREWARKKDEDILLLKEDLQALDEQSKAEEERLLERIRSLMNENDVLKVGLKQEQKAREAAEAEYLRLEEEHIILLEELSAERRKNSIDPKLADTNHWGSAHVLPAVCRVGNVDKQISDAMNAIDDLREELDTKETQLVQANMDNETEWEEREAALAQEYKAMLDMRQKQWQQLWMLKEQELLSANDKILHQLANQRGEFAIVQGAIRELEWSINRGDVDIKAKLADISKTEGMVKVHTSYLEEVDQYILDLQTKLEESEKKRKSSGIAASVRDLHRVASFDIAAVQRDRDGTPAPNIVRHDGHFTSHLSVENGMSGLRICTRSSLGDKSGLSGLSSIRKIQPDTHWEIENLSGAGGRCGNISSSTSCSQPRDDYSLSVLPPVSPGRRQQRWLVDAAWLENVRKEQASLRQSLQIERHRVSSFGQIEAEYRMIEAAVARAVEEKRESESKVLDLQQEENCEGHYSGLKRHCAVPIQGELCHRLLCVPLGDYVAKDAGCQVRNILLITFEVLKCTMCQLRCSFCTTVSQMRDRAIFITWSHVWLSIVTKMRVTREVDCCNSKSMVVLSDWQLT